MSLRTRWLSLLLLIPVLLPSLVWAQPFILRTIDGPDHENIVGRTSIEACNNAGTCVGNFIRGPVAFEVSRHDEFSLIRCPGAGVTGTAVKGLNNRGEVAGWCPRGGETVGFWRDTRGHFHFLEFPGATLTEVVGMNLTTNRQTQLIGDYRDAAGQFHGFFYADGTFITLDKPGATFTALTAINNVGMMAGFAGTPSGEVEGFQYVGGTYTPLRVPGAQITLPVDLNDQGQMVGVYVRAGAAHSFFYEEGVFRTFQVPRGEAVATDVLGLNNHEQIQGRYLQPTGNAAEPFESRGFVLRFLDGPSTLREVSEASGAAAARTGMPEPAGVGLHLDGCADAVAPEGSFIPAKIAGRTMFCKK